MKIRNVMVKLVYSYAQPLTLLLDAWLFEFDTNFFFYFFWWYTCKLQLFIFIVSKSSKQFSNLLWIYFSLQQTENDCRDSHHDSSSCTCLVLCLEAEGVTKWSVCFSLLFGFLVLAHLLGHLQKNFSVERESLQARRHCWLIACSKASKVKDVNNCLRWKSWLQQKTTSMKVTSLGEVTLVQYTRY